MARGTKEWSRQNGRKWERSLLNLLNSAVGRFWTNIEFRPIHSNNKRSTFLFTQRRTFTPQSKCKCPYPSHEGFSDYTPSHQWKFPFFFHTFLWKLWLSTSPNPLGISCALLLGRYGYWAVRFTRRFFTDCAPSLALIQGETSALILKLTTSSTLSLRGL